MRRPVNAPYTITTEFGERDSYALFGYHSGVDYAVPTGRAIYAPTGGKVVYARFHDVRGNQVVIFDGRFYHRLMHNSQFAVSEGQQVSEGQVVAYAGTTGLSTGPHCHWDINTRGIDAQAWSDFIPPADWLAGKYVVVTKGDEQMAIQSDEFIENMYLYVAGRKPTAAEIAFHKANSTSEGLLNGFIRGGDLAVKRLGEQISGLQAQVGQITKTLSEVQATLTAKQKELDAAIDDKADLARTLETMTDRQGELNKIIQVQQNQLTANNCTTSVSIKQAVQVLVQAFKDWIK